VPLRLRRSVERAGAVAARLTAEIAGGGSPVRRSWRVAIVSSAWRARARARGSYVEVNAKNSAARGEIYDCRPRDPAAPPSPPPLERPDGRPFDKVDSYVALCPADEVAVGRPIHAPKAAPPGLEPLPQDPYSDAEALAARKVADMSMAPMHGAFYAWAVGQVTWPWQDMTQSLVGSQSQERPIVVGGDYHSLSQLWALDTTHGANYNSVEVGWAVNPGFFNDTWPHLFVYRFEYGNGTCWNGCGFVATSNVVVPGMTLTYNDTFHHYGITRYGDAWWVAFDGHWLGYYPKSVYCCYFNYGLLNGHVGGEVAAGNPTSCTDMGSFGRFGEHPQAAMWNGVWRTRLGQPTQLAYLSAGHSDHSAYRTGNWYSGHPGPVFRYGGPGFC
jgi:hypothetical protein